MLINFADIQNEDDATPELWNSRYATILNAINGNLSDVNLANDSVTTAKIANGAVTSAKLDDDISPVKFSNPYKFSVHRSAALNQASSLTKVNFDAEGFDTGNNFDHVTNFRFTAPIDGFYQFTAAVSFSPTTGTGYQIALWRNGAIIKQGTSFLVNTTSGFTDTAVASGLLSLAANDYVEVFFRGLAGDPIITGSQFTSFDGFLVSAT